MIFCWIQNVGMESKDQILCWIQNVGMQSKDQDDTLLDTECKNGEQRPDDTLLDTECRNGEQRLR